MPTQDRVGLNNCWRFAPASSTPKSNRGAYDDLPHRYHGAIYAQPTKIASCTGELSIEESQPSALREITLPACDDIPAVCAPVGPPRCDVDPPVIFGCEIADR